MNEKKLSLNICGSLLLFLLSLDLPRDTVHGHCDMVEVLVDFIENGFVFGLFREIHRLQFPNCLSQSVKGLFIFFERLLRLLG